MSTIYFWFVVIINLVMVEIIGIYFLVMFFNLCANVKGLKKVS